MYSLIKQYSIHSIMQKLVTVHCDPFILDSIKELNLNWEYSPQFGKTEIDVIVPYVEYDPELDHLDDDEQICVHYDINYDFVNCIEARNYDA